MTVNSIAFALAWDLKTIIELAVLLWSMIVGSAVIVGALWYRFSQGYGAGKVNAAIEWRGIAEAHEKKISDLDRLVDTWKKAHEQCQGHINEIAQFNLRLQARERQYQRTINKLEIRCQMEPTDWNDITDAPSFDS